MKITSVQIENFLTIGRANVSLDGKGLVLIQGVNKDDTSATSNGAGKSSIPDALCWALFGETARGEAGDAVVNRTAKKDCLVIVVVQDGDSTYRIARHRKHSVHGNKTFVVGTDATGGDHDMEKGTEKETQAVIDAIMGCNHEVFAAAIYAGQEEMPDLPKMTDKELKTLIERAAGIDRLERAYTIAKQETGTAEVAVTNARHAVQLIENGLATQRTNLMQLKASSDAFEAGKPERIAAAELLVTNIVEKIRALAPSLPAAGVLEALSNEKTELSDKIANARTYTDAVSAKQRALQTAQTAHRDASNASVAATHALSLAGNATRTTPEQSWLDIPCGECGKPHTVEEFNTWREHQETTRLARIPDLQLKAQQADIALSAAVEAVDEAQRALTAAQALVPDNSAAMTRINAIDALLLGYNRTLSGLANWKTQHTNAKAAVTQVTDALNPHTANLTALAQRMREEVTKRTAATAALEAAEGQLQLKKDVQDVFGPAGVRAHILDTVTPFLNERTSEYLSALSDGNISAVWSTLATTAKGELREKFNIEVANDKGASTFKGLSGGEKRKVRLAAMLALQDLVATRATKPLSLWVGDEIDDALDPAGLERLMTILEKKARERGTVLVISHNELTDWVDQSVVVTKEGGYSTIEGVLCE